MAYIGLARPTIAKLTEPANTYADPFTCGRAIQIDITPQFADCLLYTSPPCNTQDYVRGGCGINRNEVSKWDEERHMQR